MESSSARSSAPESQLISRRTLVRAGATAVWAVPVIQIVGAAPAFAQCSGQAPSLSFNSASAKWEDSTHVRVQVSVSNTNTSVAASALTVAVGIPGTVTAGQTIKPGGWNPATISGNSLTFLAEGAVPAGGLLAFDVLVQVASGSPGGEVPVGASATCATSIAWEVGHPKIVLGTAPAQGVAQLQVPAFNASFSSTEANKLAVTASIKNNGNAATQSLKYTLTIPAGLYDAAPVATSSGVWTAATATRTGSGPWSIQFTPSREAAPGDTIAFFTQITVSASTPDTTFAGESFPMGNSATATGISSASGTPNAVTAAIPSVDVVKDSPVFVWSGSAKTTTINAYVKNIGSKTVFKPQLTISFSRPPTGLATNSTWSILSTSGNNVTIRGAETLATGAKTAQKPVFVFPTGNGNADVTVSSVTASAVS